MNRRQFVKNAGLISTWVGVSVVLHGCSGSGDDPTSPGTGGSGSVAGLIANNHGHSVAVTSAQLTAAGAVELTLSGGGHSHAMSLSAGDVISIAAGIVVQKTSGTGNGHTHGVTFN